MSPGAVSPHRARASAALALTSTVLVTVFKLSLLLIARSVFDMCSLDAFADMVSSMSSSLPSVDNAPAVVSAAARSLFDIARRPLGMLVAHHHVSRILSAINQSIPPPPIQYCVLGTGIRCGSMQDDITLIDRAVGLILSFVDDAWRLVTSLGGGISVAFSTSTGCLLILSCVVSIYLISLWYLFSLPLSMEKPLDADDLSLMIEVHRRLTLIFTSICDVVRRLLRHLFCTQDVLSAAFALIYIFKLSLFGWPYSVPTHHADGAILAFDAPYLLWYTLIGLATVGIIGSLSYTALMVYIVLRAYYIRSAAVAVADSYTETLFVPLQTNPLPDTLDALEHDDSSLPPMPSHRLDDDLFPDPSAVTFTTDDSICEYRSCAGQDSAGQDSPSLSQRSADTEQLQVSTAGPTAGPTMEEIYLTAPMHHTDVTYEFSGELQHVGRQPQVLQASAVSSRFAEGYNIHSGFLAKYELGAELGAGGNAFVIQARRRSDGQDVAVKFITTRNDWPGSRRSWVNHWLYGRVPRELWVLHSLRCDSIISLLDVFKDDSYVYIVQELYGKVWYPVGEMMNNRNLAGCIAKKRGMNINQARIIFAQVVDTVAYLHRNGVAHCDIKPENIVVDEGLWVKLIDFGSAIKVDWRRPRPYYDPRDYFGTRLYAPPEIFLKHRWQSEPADIWTLGVLLYHIVTGRLPFLDEEMIKMGLISYRETDIKDWDALIRLWPIIRGCLEVDPGKRWTAEQLMEHVVLYGFEIIDLPRVIE